MGWWSEDILGVERTKSGKLKIFTEDYDFE